MGFFIESLGNILMEAIDTVILWILGLGINFKLDIGQSSVVVGGSSQGATYGNETFNEFLPGLSNWGFAVSVFAFMCILIVTVLKMYQAMAGPFVQAEDPVSVGGRFLVAGIGSMAAYELFRYFQAGFNEVYKLFNAQYKSERKAFNAVRKKLISKRNQEVKEDVTLQNDPKIQRSSKGSTSTDVFMWSKDKLIKPDEKGKTYKLGGIKLDGIAFLLVELFVGAALLTSLVALIFEIYERYVVLAVLYIIAPLAFVFYVSKQSTVFKNYWIMVGSQFLLLCMNLLFLGVFISGWVRILTRLEKEGWAFKDSTDFIVTMLLFIGWLTAAKRMDEHLKSLGLSAAQTGQGLWGAVMGSMVVAKSGIGMVRSGLGTAGKLATGSTGFQKAARDGTGIFAMTGKAREDKAFKEEQRDRTRAGWKASDEKEAANKDAEAQALSDKQQREAANKKESERRDSLSPAEQFAEDNPDLNYTEAAFNNAQAGEDLADDSGMRGAGIYGNANIPGDGSYSESDAISQAAQDKGIDGFTASDSQVVHGENGAIYRVSTDKSNGMEYIQGLNEQANESLRYGTPGHGVNTSVTTTIGESGEKITSVGAFREAGTASGWQVRNTPARQAKADISDMNRQLGVNDNPKGKSSGKKGKKG